MERYGIGAGSVATNTTVTTTTTRKSPTSAKRYDIGVGSVATSTAVTKTTTKKSYDDLQNQFAVEEAAAVQIQVSVPLPRNKACSLFAGTSPICISCAYSGSSGGAKRDPRLSRSLRLLLPHSHNRPC